MRTQPLCFPFLLPTRSALCSAVASLFCREITYSQLPALTLRVGTCDSFFFVRGGGEDCAEHERVVMLNKQEAKAMRHYTPSASCLLTPAQDTDGAGAALRARLVAQGEEIRAALRKDKENGDLPPSAALPEQQPS